MEDFTDIYMTASTAIIPNLPHPVVKKSEDGSHAYIGIKDMIANLLAANTPVDQFNYEAQFKINGPSFIPTEPDPPTVSDDLVEMW